MLPHRFAPRKTPGSHFCPAFLFAWIEVKA
jgi:hypothetical protein